MTDPPFSNAIRPCGSSWSECGYCKGARASVVNRPSAASSQCYTCLAYNVTTSVYQDFVNRGWRRSGRSVYRPDNWQSCCPALTIRLPVAKFTPNKSQRKLQRQVANTLEGPRSTLQNHREKVAVSESCLNLLQLWTKEALDQEKEVSDKSWIPTFGYKVLPSKHGKVTLMTTVCAAIAGRSKGQVNRSSLASSLAQNLRNRLASSQQFHETFLITDIAGHAASGQMLVHGQFLDTVETTDMKVDEKIERTDKIVNWWNKVHRQESKRLRPEPLKPYRLEITTLPAHESALNPEVHCLYFYYQHKVHGDSNPLDNNNGDTGDSTELYDPWIPCAPAEWTNAARKMLDQEYQHLTPSHKQAVIRAYGEFYSFLVEHPFTTSSPTHSAHTQGTYHQQYRIAGLLIAVGVVDILPTGLSSVYLFYDPSFAHEVIPMGRYAILKEIEWTSQNNLEYYYLGYYIESCLKMRYKGDYRPSELLCPETYHWVDADEAKRIMRRDSPVRNCCRLYYSDKNGATHDDDSKDFIDGLALDVGVDRLVDLSMLQEQGQALVRPLLQEFVKEAGNTVSRQCTVSFR